MLKAYNTNCWQLETLPNAFLGKIQPTNVFYIYDKFYIICKFVCLLVLFEE